MLEEIQFPQLTGLSYSADMSFLTNTRMVRAMSLHLKHSWLQFTDFFFQVYLVLISWHSPVIVDVTN